MDHAGIATQAKVMERLRKEGVDVTIDYMPSFNQTHRQPAENRINKDYKPNLGHALNYKQGSNPEYDNNIQQSFRSTHLTFV